MKTTNNPILKSIAAGTVAAFCASSLIFSATADEKIKVKPDGEVKVKTEDGKAKIKSDGKVKIKGEGGEEAAATAQAVLDAKAAAEFKKTLVKDYVIPQESYVYLQPVPDTYVTTVTPVPEGMVYRYFDGNLYTIEPETRTVVAVEVLAD